MVSSTVLRVRLELTPTDAGGRRDPVYDGYRGAMSFGETDADGLRMVHDAVIVFEDCDELHPGDAATARAWVVPKYLPEEMAPGFEFEFVEGHRAAGRARAPDVLQDPTPFPVRDVADAKRRPLTHP